MKTFSTNSAVLLGLDTHIVTVTATATENTNHPYGAIDIQRYRAHNYNAGTKHLRTLQQLGLNLSNTKIDVVIQGLGEKVGLPAHLDLPIVVACACAVLANENDSKCPDDIILGAVEYDGSLKHPARGTLTMLLGAAKKHYSHAIIPNAGAYQASYALDYIEVAYAENVQHVVDHFTSGGKLHLVGAHHRSLELDDYSYELPGYAEAKAKLEWAATDKVHVLLRCAPGAPSLKLARWFASILPELNNDQWLEVASIQSAAGILPRDTYDRPFRAPHSSCSEVALVGNEYPGEFALAHHGVLYLDQADEFKSSCIDAVCRAVARGTSQRLYTYPANFLLVAAVSTCFCQKPNCSCTPAQLERHEKYVKPLADICLAQINLPTWTTDMYKLPLGDSSHRVRGRVTRTWYERQYKDTFAEPILAASNAQ